MENLVKAAKEFNTGQVIIALQEGADPDVRDSDGWTALHWASQLGAAQITRALIAAKANLNCADAEGITPLALAVGENRVEVIEQLIEAGANVNVRIKAYENGTVLHLACSWGKIDIVRILVKAAPSGVNISDNEGKTPLNYASDGRFVQIVEYLNSIEREGLA